MLHYVVKHYKFIIHSKIMPTGQSFQHSVGQFNTLNFWATDRHRGRWQFITPFLTINSFTTIIVTGPKLPSTASCDGWKDARLVNDQLFKAWRYGSYQPVTVIFGLFSAEGLCVYYFTHMIRHSIYIHQCYFWLRWMVTKTGRANKLFSDETS